jgi:hypothetical protein
MKATPGLFRVLFMVGALSACGRAPDGDWFVLQPGVMHRYAVTTTRDDGVTQAVWTETMREPQTWRDEVVYPRHHSEGVSFLLKVDVAGVRRVAIQPDIDDQPTDDDEPRWVLKAPYTVGTEWSVPTVPYLLRRANEYPNDLKHTHQVLMVWRIADDRASVEVPAGRFSPCLRLEGEGKLRLYTDPVKGFQDVPILGQEWYCRGQGLVQWTRSEPVHSGFYSGGEVRAQLLP